MPNYAADMIVYKFVDFCLKHNPEHSDAPQKTTKFQSIAVFCGEFIIMISEDFEPESSILISVKCFIHLIDHTNGQQNALKTKHCSANSYGSAKLYKEVQNYTKDVITATVINK